MAVTIKTEHEIELMRIAGQYLAEVHEVLADALRPGMTTKDIDRLGEKTIRKLGGVPNFLHYNGYPASVCVSVNEEVVHGIPTDKRFIEEGDLVSLDTGLIYKGYHSDAARSYVVGNCDPEKMKLVEATKESFFRGIAVATDGAHLHDIGRAEYVPITDEEAVCAFEYLAKTEGIIPAIESAHAVAHAMKLAPTMDKDKIIVITISGRGDKDCAAIARYRGEDIHE